ncbi:exodeoxyribonuclease V subunit alpha [Mannheimia sp. AT1]|uniref:RecBCD enzyme subunit RecD n=1 Tax=Mannheimia cairinae TaxID=3025936 RepID=A0ABT5MP87_9PAST|nr:exodeoxyribonuclease V subunit alpha [Mannheimia cairinae]MDD0823990.1 exodeoxyribonuclease V subunit alpha [Mannheimia cairinae]MDD0825306.1 exodeoxyribonuclease V subunit alpha [Mannheimia cairinae]
MLNLLFELKQEKIISDLNYQFAKLIDNKQQEYPYSPLQKNLAVLLSALISYHIGQGHTALRLDSVVLSNLFELKGKSSAHHLLPQILQKIEEIQPLAWQETLDDHIAFSNKPEKVSPMLFQNGLLYFYRYWQAENNIASYLAETSSKAITNENLDLDKSILEKLFEQKESIDWQKIAVATALRKSFCLISGGPGTGKTTTVVKLLAALQTKCLQQNRPYLNIALVAPTGKAASRMEEPIEKNLSFLNLSFLNEKEQEVREHIPKQAKTIHRLLGLRPLSDKAKYNKQNPLHYDLLVVDEASMIDLSLMDKLIQAIRADTRLIILGDKDQLASVEAGAIMGELGEFSTLGYSQEHIEYLQAVANYQLDTSPHTMPICDSLCHLRESQRFDKNSGIFRLAQAVNEQQRDSWEIISQHQDLDLIGYAESAQFNDKASWIEQTANLVIQKAVEHYREYLELVQKRERDPASIDIAEIFLSFQKVRFLSALRVSELGVERLNQRIAEALRNSGLIRFNHSWDRYIGKPILITENSERLSSGDVGIILVNENSEPRAYFDKKDKHTNEYLNLPLSQIPQYEVSYVMTVHKSQGSEFEHTLLILPLESSPVLTKELVYTAITRASKKFTLFGSKKIWENAVKTRIQRQSGLKAQLNSVF